MSPMSTTDCDARSALNAIHPIEPALAPAAPSQRSFVRHSIRGDAILHPLENGGDEGATIRIQLRDVSLNGVGFLCSRPLPADSIWRAAFVVKDYAFGQQPLRVHHCRQVPGGAYLIGAQFCIEPAVLCLLGVDSALLALPDNFVPIRQAEGESFSAPDALNP